MKIVGWILIGIALVLVPARAAAAATAQQVASEHLAKATAYEAQAKTQSALISEHEQEKKEYKNKYYINDKVTPPQRFAAFEKHCDSVIADAAKLRDELSDFAKWHRLQAAELQGK